MLKIIQKYKYYITLTFSIFILFISSTYSSPLRDYTIYVNNKNISLEHKVYSFYEKKYVHLNDLITVFSNNIYYDKVSGKIIITTNSSIYKIERNDDLIIKNIDNEMYLDLEYLMNKIGYKFYVQGKNIYLTDYKVISVDVVKNRVEVYSKKNVICFIDKGLKITVQMDENLTNSSSNMVNVNFELGGKIYYGKVLKSNLNFKYIQEEKIENKQAIIISKAEKDIYSNTDLKKIDIVAVDMLRLSGVNTVVELEHTKNFKNMEKIYATINNGQKSSNYDSEIVSRMLNSEENRENVIKIITEYLKNNNIDGINVEFSNVRDTKYYLQFLKELSATLHLNKKEVMITISNISIPELASIGEIVDYIIVKAYGARTISSKTSGPISSVDYVENIIKNIVATGVNVQKVVIEVPAYTILWTERKGTIINAEIYSMLASNEYVTLNDLEVKIDEKSKQNYINYSKGITSYKMWLEDGQSIKNKASLINKYNLAGISLYKSGMEEKNVYSIIYDTIKLGG